MRRGLPDDETVRAAVTMAISAPSVHNTQPWKWRVGDSSVHLWADRTRQLVATDPGATDLMLSCGAALHHLRVGFAALDWGCRVHRLPNPADPDHLAAVEVFPRDGSDEEMRLANVIRKRRTDRRRYSDWAVPPETLRVLAKAAENEGVLLRVADNAMIRYQLVSAIAQAAALQTMDPAYRIELAEWSGYEAGATDGIPAANTPLVTGWYGDLPMRPFPRGRLATAPPPDDQAAATQGAGELLVLSTTSDDGISRLKAGEAMSAVLLSATDLGLASSPLSQPLELDSIREVLRADVLADTAYPQIVLRIGWPSTGAEPLPSTPRRPLAEVLSRLS
jgi:hypothetical protein